MSLQPESTAASPFRPQPDGTSHYSTLLAWFSRFSRNPHLPSALGLLAFVLALPAVATGFQFDDYRLRATLLGPGGLAPLPRALSQLFVFTDGDPAHGLAQMVSGALPWWALPAGLVAFWRPVAALTHWIDFALWPANPALMHLHSLVWLGLLVAAAAWLYRQVGAGLAPPVAALAGLLFALDPAHGFAASWLSNRNILLAALFGVLALGAHLRWRRDGWRPGGLLGPLLLLLALLSAEAAVAVWAYWLAYALCLDRGRWPARLLALAPAAVVTLAWLWIHRAMGYGLWGTSYLDPLREPLPFARAVAERGPLLLVGQWFLPPVEIVNFLSPAAARVVWAAAVLVLAPLAWALWPVARRSPTARFWGIGLLLAVVPACAALPANRLLFFVGLGAAGLLAEFIRDGLSPTATAGFPRVLETWANIGLTGLLVALHLAIAPALLPVMAFSPRLLGGLQRGLDSTIASLPADPALARQTAVIVYAPNFADSGYIGLLRPELGLPAPARVRALVTGLGLVDVQRSDAQTLVVRASGGYLNGYETVFRGPAHPLALGQVVDLGDMQATVIALTTDGRPATVAFHFALPLEDPSLRWFRWSAGLYVPFAPPALGADVQISPQASAGP